MSYRSKWRRASRAWLGLLVVAGGLVAGVPVGEASAAKPLFKQCPARFSDQPVADAQKVPWDCVGSRLVSHVGDEYAAPELPPSVPKGVPVTVSWPAHCRSVGTVAGPDGNHRYEQRCVEDWVFRVSLWRPGPDGSATQEGFPRTVGVRDSTGANNCLPWELVPTGVWSCRFEVFGGPVPKGTVALVGFMAKTVQPCNLEPKPYDPLLDCDFDEADLPWFQAAIPVGGAPPEPKELELSLTAFAPGEGYPLDGVITLAQTMTVELALANETDETLTDLAFAEGNPLVIDPRGTGGLEVVAGPNPPIDPALTLAPGDEKTFTFEVEATANGIAAAHSQVTAVDPGGEGHQDGHSLKFAIEDGIEITRAAGQWLRMQAMDQLLQETFGQAYGAMVERGQTVSARMAELFPPERRLQWFGSETGFPLTPTDFSIALLRGAAPEMVAALLPKEDIDGHTSDELNQVYNETIWTELGKGGAKYVKGWTDLGAETQKFVKDSWAESMLTANYVLGSATHDERAQFEAFAMHLIDGTAADTNNLVNAVKEEIPKWRENGTYLAEALYETQAGGGIEGAMETAGKLKEAYDAETAARDELLKLADTDPVAFQRQWAKRDAQILNKGLVPIFDTLIGGGVVKGAGKLKGVIFKGNGAGIIRAGEASGVLDKGANVAKRAPKIAMGGGAAPQGLANGEVAELTRKGNYLENVEGATVVQSSDLGNVYEMPNLGGVPETTLEAKAAILRSLEQEYLEKTGQTLQLAEVLKPSSALRKVGGVAKTELTAAKTGKAAMLDAGAPKDILAEANVWKGPDPRTLPGFGDLPKLRQQAAIKEWEKAKKSWDAYHNPAAGSKEERLRQVVGQEARVPLDVKPNEAGLQRFVTAHYEEVHITQGQAQAKLIRVKKYQIEVVDTTRNNQVVNRKTVVDLPEAAPQTPDADAAGMAKVVGRDPAGKPILEPLSRAEREFVMQRYIDKNIKARRLPPGTRGAINDLAEHGTTLVMDDASAQAAGKLLPMFGVPFLPGGVGRAYLKRIAPFVAAKNATPAQVNAMYRQMVALVQSEGGFAQHAVVVTSDSRYLGAIPFASW